MTSENSPSLGRPHFIFVWIAFVYFGAINKSKYQWSQVLPHDQTLPQARTCTESHTEKMGRRRPIPPLTSLQRQIQGIRLEIIYLYIFLFPLSFPFPFPSEPLLITSNNPTYSLFWLRLRLLNPIVILISTAPNFNITISLYYSLSRIWHSWTLLLKLSLLLGRIYWDFLFPIVFIFLILIFLLASIIGAGFKTREGKRGGMWAFLFAVLLFHFLISWP